MTTPLNGQEPIARRAGRIAESAASALLAAAIMGLFGVWYFQGRLDERVATEEAKSKDQAAMIESVRGQMGTIAQGVARIEGIMLAEKNEK